MKNPVVNPLVATCATVHGAFCLTTSVNELIRNPPCNPRDHHRLRLRMLSCDHLWHGEFREAILRDLPAKIVLGLVSLAISDTMMSALDFFCHFK